MSRIDKYDPVSGGFRAPLAANYAGSETPVGVGLDVNGRVVVGAGNTGIVGVLCRPPLNPQAPYLPYNAGTQIDVMTDGELVEFGGTPGTVYYVRNSNGAIEPGVAGGGPPVVTGETFTRVGHTVEGSRLIVRAAR